MNFDSMHQIELGLMSQLQFIKGPLLNEIMLFLNNLDTSPFFYALIIIAWYGYRQKLGIELLFLFILNVIINQDIKMSLSQPRPYQLDPSLGLMEVPFFGFPSGAAQLSTAFCGYIALKSQKGWVWTLSLLYLMLISFSRIYLGVHFPTDILGGWILGGITLCGCYLAFPKIESYLNKQSKFRLLMLSCFGALAFSLVSFSSDAFMKICGGLGASFGLIYAPSYLEKCQDWQKVYRILLALVGIYAITTLQTFSQLFSSNKMIHLMISAFFMFICGFWISYGLPWLLSNLETKTTSDQKENA